MTAQKIATKEIEIKTKREITESFIETLKGSIKRCDPIHEQRSYFIFFSIVIFRLTTSSHMYSVFHLQFSIIHKRTRVIVVVYHGSNTVITMFCHFACTLIISLVCTILPCETVQLFV